MSEEFIENLKRRFPLTSRQESMYLKHTWIEDCDTWVLRKLVAPMLPNLEWRRHGIGVLQAYVAEGPLRELRVHIWNRDLMLDGISDSGNAHNHRFKMCSTILAGRLLQTEYQLTPYDNGDHELWTFVHARLHTEANRAEMVRTGERCHVDKVAAEIGPHSRYIFDRFAFHSSEPVSDLVVTLVEKLDQADVQAKVVAPVNVPPVPAFSGDPPRAEEINALVERAMSKLLED